MSNIVKKDVVIFGGGIAGLWLLNRLRTEGYDAVLFEHKALGHGQSVASQGMIHGGMKYALNGKLNSASNAIADMPAHWKSCLQGQGDVDLRGAHVLSEQYYMWPKSSVRSRFNAFLGSKAVRGKVDPVDKANFPSFFKGKIDGPLYQLNDIVLDVPSLLRTLSENQRPHIHLLNWQHAELVKNESGGIKSLVINQHGDPSESPLDVQAQRFIFSSGAGTSKLLDMFDLAPTDSTKSSAAPFAMQLRPLQMVMVKHDMPNPIYVHCIADQLRSTPELTITSHQCADGKWVWYLGGELAEAGTDRTCAEQIEAAKNKLHQLFPWCDFSTAQWQTLFIDRAEAKQKNGKRPEHASVIARENIYVCWPTKLTLAPTLADAVMTQLKTDSVKPGTYEKQACLTHLPFPEIAPCPWDNMSS